MEMELFQDAPSLFNSLAAFDPGQFPRALLDQRERERASLVRVDVAESATSYLVTADAAGVPKANMRVDIDDSRSHAPLLHIALERPPFPSSSSEPAKAAAADAANATPLAQLKPGPDEQVAFLHTELGGGRLHRTLRLPRAGLLQLDKITCCARDGLLRIVIPRSLPSEAEERRTVRVA